VRPALSERDPIYLWPPGRVQESCACLYWDHQVRVCAVLVSDRKGLVYDLMRTLKDIHIRVAYGKVAVLEDRERGSLCEVDLFVQEVDGSRISDRFPCLSVRTSCLSVCLYEPRLIGRCLARDRELQQRQVFFSVSPYVLSACLSV
jgi:hypothetical protein